MRAEAARRVPYLDFPAQFASERSEIFACVERVFGKGDFIDGAAIGELEKELAPVCGGRQIVALNSGTDALVLGLVALGIGQGDEVITPANSFVASTAAIVRAGAAPVFADVLADQTFDPASVEAAITPRTKAIMPVHLTGRMADMDRLLEVARRHKLAVIEDSAQSIGSLWRGRPSGAFGDFSAFSAHPLKNLNAAGDAGFLATAHAAIGERVRRLRNHGLADRDNVLEFGWNSRMDTLQAEILRMRLKKLPEVIARRRRNAEVYGELLDRTHVFFPPLRGEHLDTFHLFVIQVDRRDELKAFLSERGIGTKVHYPIPIHLQPAAAPFSRGPGSLPVTEEQAQRILSIPIHQFLTQDDLEYVARTINEFYRRGSA